MDPSLDSAVSYEELAEVEKDFDEVEMVILRKQNALQAPLYEKRKALVSRVPLFWPLVLEQAPPEIDQFIQPTDSTILATHLLDLDVTRFDIPPHSDDEQGEPRSFAITLRFTENEYFEDACLEKRFCFRRAHDGWTGLVSDPVKIRWKAGMDLTQGLTDGAYAAWEAEKAHPDWDPSKPLPEHQMISSRMETHTEGSMSFFAWFGYRGRRVSAEESTAANAAETERRERWKAGDKTASNAVPDHEPPEIEDDTEIFPMGEELAIAISEDLFPSALKYFTQSHDEEGMSDVDFEGSDDDNGPVNLRALVDGDGDSDDVDSDRPKKKQRA
ncbi:MAG: hypothetical protein M1838_000571 [Thelocarpon superellum]|nr:MAG: hypothetical protein M1838_000571 [Thelocarpon superellum]